MTNKVKRIVIFLHCWLFGHEPDYSASVFDHGHEHYGWHTPCKKCGLWDIDYHELVTGSRYKKYKEFFQYWLFRRWIPEKCYDCKKRYGNHKDCLPF